MLKTKEEIDKLEYNQLNLTNLTTGGIITGFKEETDKEVNIEIILLTFDNGYILEVDIPLEKIRELIREKKYVSIHYTLDVFKEFKNQLEVENERNKN